MTYPNVLLHYRSVPENNDYLLINVRCDLSFLIRDDERIPNETYAELQDIYFSLYQFEYKLQMGHISEDIAIRKDSLVGRFILSHPEIFIDEDTEITYKKVVGAYNVAVFQNDTKMANKILPLFQGRISGTKDELCSMFRLDVLDNILENGDFDAFLKRQDGKEADKEGKEYIVFENGEYSKKKLGTLKENASVEKAAYKVKKS